MDGRVFISHSSYDRGIADPLCAALESQGVACWIAPRDIQPGAEWAEQIIDGIDLADVMLLILSSHANASPQVRREVERAVHRQLALLPVRVENVLPSKGLGYFLGTQHWLDAHAGPIDQHWAAIARAVKALRSKPAAPMPWTPSALAKIQALLAEHVGPVAGALVKRAAARAAHPGALVDALAAEIDEASARSAFVAACRGDRWAGG